jgi:SAM-dependent methyltransferase
VHAASLVWIALLSLAVCHARSASAAAPPRTAADSVIADLRAEAKALRPLVKTAVARAFLDEVARLPAPSSRTVVRDSAGTRYWSARAASVLPDSMRARLVTRTLPPAFFYQTRYGTPLAYARPLEILGRAGLRSLEGRRVLDFGYGTIGHLRLLAGLGAEVTGVEVDPLFPALYSEPGDTDVIARGRGKAGRITLLNGSFPGDAALATAAGGGYTLIVSKNTLKRGYVHPEQPVDPRRMVHLGVSDTLFVREVYDRLAPGGWFLIYNLSPAPAPPDKPYIPWADGRSPFSRALLESTGFQVVAFDQEDSPAARAMAKALGWDQGPSPMDLEHNLFGMYTLARRPER